MFNIPSERAKRAWNDAARADAWHEDDENAAALAIDAHFPNYEKLQAVYDAAVAWMESDATPDIVAAEKRLEAAVRAVKEHSNG